MIVERRLFIAKPGHTEDMVTHIRSLLDGHAYPGTVRLYRSKVGMFNQVAVELEGESLAACDETFNQWASVAFTPEAHVQWVALEESGAKNEFWSIANMWNVKATANTGKVLVNRRTWIARPGKAGDAIDFISSWFEDYTWPGAVRLYRNHLAPFDHVALEVECESLAAYEEHWGRWEASHEEGVKLVESGGANEIWTIEGTWAVQ